jgi:hypothetical protein
MERTMAKHRRDYRLGKVNIEIGKGQHGRLTLYEEYAGRVRGRPELTHNEMLDEALVLWLEKEGVTHEELVQRQLEFLMGLGEK